MEQEVSDQTTPLWSAIAGLVSLGLVVSQSSAQQGLAQQGMSQMAHPDMPDPTHGKQGITHRALLLTDIAGLPSQEVIVWDTEYAPRAINPRHYHPVAITFRV